ncbi:hypothetical protein [Priestia megaterium]|uniref:hypothetical protein n=1 Tax=Priestia megaterium TaxID=1404 RepID=UPI000BFC61FF|nr:hypothetical protein [Priestia megaterium]PGO60644.1 hypothetical protein CN981_08835 [Priestia megaterium]
MEQRLYTEDQYHIWLDWLRKLERLDKINDSLTTGYSTIKAVKDWEKQENLTPEAIKQMIARFEVEGFTVVH